MTIRASVFIATSLDGFIAREDGDVEWLTARHGEEGEDFGYHEFIATVDLLVMGRKSFEKVLEFDAWPYEEKPVVVMTGRPLEVPAHLVAKVEGMSCSPTELVERLAARGARHLYVDGGRTIQSFLEAGLIQRLVITTIPVLLGSGIPLFGPLSRDVELRLVRSKSFANGFVQNEYEVLDTAT